MSFANEKGGHYLTLTVLQTESNEVNCMLKNPILKKSENWAIQLVDFILSKQPLINPNIHLPFLEIKHYGLPFHATVDLAAIYGDRTVFTPKNCTTVIGLFKQLSQFCKVFSRMFLAYGLGDDAVLHISNLVSDDFMTNAHRANTAIDPYAVNALEGDVISVELDADLKILFRFGKYFCQDFYIELSEYASEIVGLPKQLFHVQAAIVGHPILTNTSSLINPLIHDGGAYLDANTAIANRTVIEDDVFGNFFQSEESIKNYDERMSLDLVSTFPTSRKVCVFNGEQSEEYLLGRFDLSNFRDFETEGEMVNDVMRYNVIETFHPAAFNLTKGFPNYENNHFINGPLRSVNFRLFMRYINQKKEIKKVVMNMKDGFFQVKCLFTKKI